jgi:predicted acyltransferase
MDGLMETPPSKPDRLQSLDTFRGFAMFLMAMELLRLPQLAEHFSFSAIWRMIGFHSDHVVWTGCSLHDLIQPAFSFMVGMALPFSIASRQARGQTNQAMLTHALWRAFILVAIGVVLRFIDVRHLHLTFEDTLAQIGLGYPFLALLAGRVLRTQVIAGGAVLGPVGAVLALPGANATPVGSVHTWVTLPALSGSTVADELPSVVSVA